MTLEDEVRDALEKNRSRLTDNLILMCEWAKEASNSQYIIHVLGTYTRLLKTVERSPDSKELFRESLDYFANEVAFVPTALFEANECDITHLIIALQDTGKETYTDFCTRTGIPYLDVCPETAQIVTHISQNIHRIRQEYDAKENKMHIDIPYEEGKIIAENLVAQKIASLEKLKQEVQR